MEPSVFNNLNSKQQGWLMSVVPSMCNHPDEQIETKAIHAVGDMILIKGLREDPGFVGNITEILLRKTKEKSEKIFSQSTIDNTLRSKFRNDLIYSIACIGNIWLSENFDFLIKFPKFRSPRNVNKVPKIAFRRCHANNNDIIIRMFHIIICLWSIFWWWNSLFIRFDAVCSQVLSVHWLTR